MTRITYLAAMAVASSTCLAAQVAAAQGLPETTRLFDIRLGGGLSAVVEDASTGGYHLSGGEPVHFADWYSGSWRDLSLTWLTSISNGFGVFWGLGTGEHGPKYDIDPSLRLGFIFEQPVTDTQTLSLSIMTVLGGRLSERTCTADYGAIGGVQAVNCRLAASVLPPSDTLNYLFDDMPLAENQVHVRYSWRF